MKMKYIVGLISLIFFIGCATEAIQECQIESETAILDINLNFWGIDENNNDSILINYYIINFGDVESNIEVKCVIFDLNGEMLASNVQILNMTSHTVQEGQVQLDLTLTHEEIANNKGTYCYVNNCSNCDILHKRLPQTLKLIEALNDN